MKKEADKTVINIDDMPIQQYLPKNLRNKSRKKIEFEELREYNLEQSQTRIKECLADIIEANQTE